MFSEITHGMGSLIKAFDTAHSYGQFLQTAHSMGGFVGGSILPFLVISWQTRVRRLCMFYDIL
jgi:hypothetical protein